MQAKVNMNQLVEIYLRYYVSAKKPVSFDEWADEFFEKSGVKFWMSERTYDSLSASRGQDYEAVSDNMGNTKDSEADIRNVRRRFPKTHY